MGLLSIERIDGIEMQSNCQQTLTTQLLPSVWRIPLRFRLCPCFSVVLLP